jgi:hypothetical protein
MGTPKLVPAAVQEVAFEFAVRIVEPESAYPYHRLRFAL